jgi:hypothetical protein
MLNGSSSDSAIGFYTERSKSLARNSQCQTHEIVCWNLHANILKTYHLRPQQHWLSRVGVVATTLAMKRTISVHSTIFGVACKRGGVWCAWCECVLIARMHVISTGPRAPREVCQRIDSTADMSAHCRGGMDYMIDELERTKQQISPTFMPVIRCGSSSPTLSGPCACRTM